MFILSGIFVISSIGLLGEVFAEESPYVHVGGIHAVTTFTFRDGVETLDFPVFSTTSDVVSNVGTTFAVEGVVTDAPFLYESLDQAYAHRMMTLTAGSSFEYDYRFFDVDVDILQGENLIKSIHYNNCEVLNYNIDTITDDYESYLLSDSGFAIADKIEFRCGGVHFGDNSNIYDSRNSAKTLTDYGTSPFKFAEDVRVFTTFEFDNGMEKMEFVIFTLTSGFNEASDAGPSFQLISAVSLHPLLDNAIHESTKVSGLALSFNEDFDVLAEFENSEGVLRGIDFEDCIISGYGIQTLRDKEEGYTGKRGFAVAEIIDVSCSGMIPLNPHFDKVMDTQQTRGQSVHNTYMRNSYNMGAGPHVIASFEFDGGTEIIDFPEFKQNNLLTKSNPSFELVGVPGNYPLLYDVVDETRKTGQKTTGSSTLVELFDVNVVLAYGHDVVRGFEYTKCRVTDYIIKTEHDAEESFFKGFALTNEFSFECQGYHPYNPMYDAMFSYEKPKVKSSLDYQAEQISYGDTQPLFSSNS